MAREQLLHLLGRDFLAYVLALDAQADLLEVALSAEQERVADYLETQFRDIIDSSGKLSLAQYHRATNLTWYLEPARTSLINALRLQAGGLLPEVDLESPDGVLEPLLIIARDVWPGYLLPRPIDISRAHALLSPGGIYQHPVAKRFWFAILQDGDLARLFPQVDESAGAITWDQAMDLQSMVWSSTGSGGTQQLSMLLTQFLADGVQRALLTAGVLTWDTLRPQLAATVAGARGAARGEVVSVPALVGFAGLQLSQAAEISVATGKLRQPRPVDTSVFLPSDAPISAVLETTFPLEYLRVEAWAPDSEAGHDESLYRTLQPHMEEAYRAFQQQLDLIRLALLLGSTDAEPLLTVELSRIVLDPIRPNGASLWTGARLWIPSHVVQPHEQQAVAAWHAVLVENHVASLDVAMRRLLSAASSRTDANDAFVDAVICWENVFGTRVQTTKQVTGALAKLLEPHDLQRRQELLRELRKLYGIRSDLVHGGQEPVVQKSWELRNRVIQLAKDCLRTLYMTRPDLIPLDSERRGLQLLSD